MVVKDKAVIKEHALLQGKCCISGSAKILGYSRVDYDVGSINVINAELCNDNVQPFLKQRFIEILKYEKEEG